MSLEPVPGGSPPEISSGGGGQVGGTGGVVSESTVTPGQSVQEAEASIRQLLRTRKREELRKLRREIAESCKPFLKMSTPGTYFAYRLYNSLVFGERETKRLAVVAEVLELPVEDIVNYANKNLEGFKVNSARRILETCENMKAMKLVNFHYNFEKIRDILDDIWWPLRWEQGGEGEKVGKLKEAIKTMTVKELLTSWNEVSQRLLEIEKKYNRRGALVPAMRSAFREQTYLYNALTGELRKLLVERLGATDGKVSTLFEDLPMLLYLEYTGREY